MSLISNSNVVVAQLPVIGYAFACWFSTQYLLCLEVITKRSQGIFPASLEVTEQTILSLSPFGSSPWSLHILFYSPVFPGSFSNNFFDKITGTKQGPNIVFVVHMQHLAELAQSWIQESPFWPVCPNTNSQFGAPPSWHPPAGVVFCAFCNFAFFVLIKPWRCVAAQTSHCHHSWATALLTPSGNHP